MMNTGIHWKFKKTVSCNQDCSIPGNFLLFLTVVAYHLKPSMFVQPDTITLKTTHCVTGI